MPKPTKRFAKIYTEITTVCNLKCEFCHGTVRPAKFISTDDFALFASKAAPFTDHIYLHVMGEPLLHPQLGELIDIAAKEGLKVSITTNGTLLEKQLPLLLKKAEKLYKISISLHSFEANSGINMAEYLDSCISSAKTLGQAGVITALRLWNLEGGSAATPANTKNNDILTRLKNRFGDEWSENRKGFKIGEKVYLEYGKRFDWPDAKKTGGDTHGFCYAMKDHIAVLCDGSVVPCCLDADGIMTLGNLKEISLGEILDGEKARLIAHGFLHNTLVHPMCQTCGARGLL